LIDFARAARTSAFIGRRTRRRHDVDFGEVLEFALADSTTDGILVYVESLPRGLDIPVGAARRRAPSPWWCSRRTYHDACRGAHDDARPDRVFDAALKRAGTVRVRTYTQLLLPALILGGGRIPRGDRLAIVTNGRGPV